MVHSIDPYIKLLGTMDLREEAWRTSRPGTTEVDMEKIGQMDFSLNSMCVYTFEMRSSVFMRDLIFSIRPLEAWAQSVRALPKVDDSNIAISGEYQDGLGVEGIDHFFSRLAGGETRDQARECLPLSVSCVYTFTIDRRALISFCKNIQSLNHRLFCEYCIPMITMAGISGPEYDSCNVRESMDYYQISSNEMIEGLDQTGNMMHGHYRMKMALASQFLRQHHSKIKLGLWHMIGDYYEMDIRQSDQIDVVFYIDVHAYRQLMAARSHWMLDWHMDMWGSIVGDYITRMSTGDFWHFTPSGAGRPDPYFADNYNRIQLEDPGLPCPILTQNIDMIHQRRAELGDNPILDMYEKLFVEGYVHDNPDNNLRLKYLSNLEQKACPN